MSRVLRLPIPAKSTQLLGKDFVGEEGRGANLIDIGNGTVVVRANSFVPSSEATSAGPLLVLTHLATLVLDSLCIP